MRARHPAVLALLALAALAGCLSLKRTPAARFFALRPVAEPPGTPSPAGENVGIVGVLPVLLPGHLERPQIVAWTGPGEVKIDEFLRWSEPLDLGVQRVLAENLETLLPSYRVIKSPWPSSTALRCRVRVELSRFGLQPGGEVYLSGSYVLLPEHSERALVSRGVELRRDPVSGPDEPGRAVESMSGLLSDLSGRIAEAIVALPPEPAPKPSPTETAPPASR